MMKGISDKFKQKPTYLAVELASKYKIMFEKTQLKCQNLSIISNIDNLVPVCTTVKNKKNDLI